MKKLLKIFFALTLALTMMFSNLSNVNAWDSSIPHEFTQVKSINYPWWWSAKIDSTKQWSTTMSTYNGNIAYCLEASKNTPISGSYVASVINNNSAVKKLLYYGYGGPGYDDNLREIFEQQMESCVPDDFGTKHGNFDDGAYLFTHIWLSYAYSGDLMGLSLEEFNAKWPNPDGNGGYGDNIMWGYNIITSMLEPKDAMFNINGDSVLSAKLTATYDKENKIQKTETVTFEAGGNATTNITLQDNVTLHNVTTGTTQIGGTATVYGGQSFYLTAPLKNAPEDYVSGNIAGNNCETFNALAIIPGGSYQAEGSWTKDPALLKYSVDWMDFGKIEITKTNTNHDLIDGAIFNLKSTSFEGHNEDITVTDGKIVVDYLPVGTYELKEIQAPDGYLLNETVYTITVNKDQTTTQTVVNEEPTGSIDLTKEINSDLTDGNIGDAYLKGNKYTLKAKEKITNKAGTVTYFEKDAVVDTQVTDEQGKLKFDDLHIGKYYIEESKSNGTLVLNPDDIDVSIDYEGQTVSKILRSTSTDNRVNMQKVQVHKFGEKESESGILNGLAGAEFTFKLKSEVDKVGWDKAKTYDVITTGKDGRATTKYLPYGTYLVRETKTPQDYMTAPDFTISVTKDYSEYEDIDQIKIIDINNRPYTTQLKLVKKDLDSDKTVTLNSATFKVKAREDIVSNGKVIYKAGDTIKQKISGKTYDSFTTSANNVVVPDGSFEIDGEMGTVILPLQLDAGKYYIDEIKTPTGYLALESRVEFDIENIRDYDKDEDGDPILEVIIKNDKPVGELIVNKSVDLNEEADLSLVNIDDLSGIKFRLTAKEDIIDPADGSIIYAKDATVGEYNLSKDGKLTVSDLPMGIYELQEITTLDGLVLDGTKHEVKFEQSDLTTKVYTVTQNLINKPTEVEISKTDVTAEKELEGAEMTVLDKNGNVIDQWISTGKAHIIEGLLVNQTYILRENLAPLGYVKANDVSFVVKNTTELQKVHMIDKIVEVNKTNVTGKGLEGATLQIVSTKTKNIVDQWVVDESGSHNVNGLIAGESYILRELQAPESYVKAKEIKFIVEDDNKNQTLSMIDKQVEISKCDVSGEELSGAHMQILDKEGKIVDEWISMDSPHYANNLVEGASYVLHEDLSPLGYALSNDIEFTVSYDKETQKIEMIDTINKVAKVDEEGKYLKGATLEVVSTKTKDIVDRWTTGQHIFNISEEIKEMLLNGETVKNIMIEMPEDSSIEYTITPNEDTKDYTLALVKEGVVSYYNIDIEGNETTHMIQGLLAGEEYILRETQAPEGYATAEEQKFVAGEEEDISLIMIDEDTKVEISKQDITTNKELPGASLVVKDKDGNVVDEWVSTAEPHIIKNLTVGKTYTLSETIAPDGYKIAQSIDFKIEDTGEVQNVVMYDELLPSSGGVKTYDDTDINDMIVSASMTVLGMVSYGMYEFFRKRYNQ